MIQILLLLLLRLRDKAVAFFFCSVFWLAEFFRQHTKKAEDGLKQPQTSCAGVQMASVPSKFSPPRGLHAFCCTQVPPTPTPLCCAESWGVSYTGLCKHLHFVSPSGQINAALQTCPVIPAVLPQVQTVMPLALLGEQRQWGDAVAEQQRLCASPALV